MCLYIVVCPLSDRFKLKTSLIISYVKSCEFWVARVSSHNITRTCVPCLCTQNTHDRMYAYRHSRAERHCLHVFNVHMTIHTCVCVNAEHRKHAYVLVGVWKKTGKYIMIDKYICSTHDTWTRRIAWIEYEKRCCCRRRYHSVKEL